MVINESELEFVFNEGVNAIKFDDTEFYRKSFNRLPGAKGVDIIAHSNNEIQMKIGQKSKQIDNTSNRLNTEHKKYKTYSMDLKKELIEKVIMKNIIIH